MHKQFLTIYIHNSSKVEQDEYYSTRTHSSLKFLGKNHLQKGGIYSTQFVIFSSTHV